MRKLTTKFLASEIAKFEKRNNCGILDGLDVGNLAVNKIADLVRAGNKGMTEEQSYTKVDEYLADDENTLIDCFIDIAVELDSDIKVFKKLGLSEEKLRAQFEASSKQAADKLDDGDVFIESTDSVE